MTAVETDRLGFAIEGIPIVDDVTMRIDPGEFVAIEGPSGSGKSTLLNLIAGLEAPTDGTVRVLDHALDVMTERQRTVFRRRNIGVVFQLYDLLPTLSAWQNVAIPRLLDGGSFGDSRHRAVDLLQQVGLADRIDHRPPSLSGGEQQRVAIARALMNDPPLLLADEPTGALDSVAGDAVLELLAELPGKGRTVVMVTHSARAAAYAGRSLRLLDGTLVNSKEMAASRSGDDTPLSGARRS